MKKKIIFCLKLLAVIIALIAIYLLWFITGTPTIDVDYLAQYNQLYNQQLPDEDNAWKNYEKAAQLYIPPDSASCIENLFEMIGKPSFRFEDLNPKQREEIRNWINENLNDWDKFDSQQKAIFQKYFDKGFVPISFMSYEFSVTTFNLYLKSFFSGSAIGFSVIDPCYIENLELPNSELKELIQNTHSMLQSFNETVRVAALKYWIEGIKSSSSEIIPLTNHEYNFILDYFEKNKAAWSQIEQGGKKQSGYLEVKHDVNEKDKSLLNAILPYQEDLRGLAKIGIWQAEIDLQQGKTEEAFEKYLAIVQCGAHLQGNGWLIQQLSGLNFNYQGLEKILYILARADLKTENLKRFEKQLQKIYSKGYPAIELASERLYYLDVVQHLFTKGGLGGGHLIPKQFQQEIMFESFLPVTMNDETPMFKKYYFSVIVSLLHERRNKTAAKFEEAYEQMKQIAALTPYERYSKQFMPEKNWPRVNFFWPFQSFRHDRYFLLGCLLPGGIQKISDIRYRQESLYEAVLTVIGLRLMKLERGEYPETLEELVAAGYLEELPMDPFSDKPLVYKKTSDNFILYSVGHNFKDDGGEIERNNRGEVKLWGDNGDAVFWPLKK